MTTTTPAPRQSHPYYMYDAILSQPDAIASVLTSQSAICDDLGPALATRRRIYLVGIGTSWHAALAAQQMLTAGPETFACNSFEFCTAPPRVTPDDAVIVFSHRGTKRSSYDALDYARSTGAFTVAITSTAPGPRIQAAHRLIHTVSPEISSAFTVSYTTALTVIAMLNRAIAAQTGRKASDPAYNQVDALPNLMSHVLAAEDDVRGVALDNQSRRRFISAGWGAHRANAYEVALKIKETSRADCEGFQMEQLLHGPFCSLDSDCLLTLIAPPGDDRGRTLNLSLAARELGAPVWALMSDPDPSALAAGVRIFKLPACPPNLMPIISVAPLQLFTYHLALARGRHPDLFQQDDPLQAAARTHYDL